jgi:3-hydroxybutyrate dehydrogenase
MTAISLDLSGRVAIVTGAAGGLGRVIRTTLSELGCAVVAVDLHGDDVLHADVSTDEGNQSMVAHAIDQHGRLDIVVLNAGTQHMAPIAEFALADFERLQRLMVTGPFLAMKHAWPHLISQPQGRIIVTASTSSLLAEAYKSAYTAAKHGVVGLVRVAALEAAGHGLTVNAVAPAGMYTPLVEQQMVDQQRLHGQSRDEVLERWVARHAVKRFVGTEEVAAVIAFLASPLSSGITGALLPVDLGTLAW